MSSPFSWLLHCLVHESSYSIISTHCAYSRDSSWFTRDSADSNATHLDSLYAPFPLTHSVFFMYINPVNYLWALQLNLLYSWCNTELFTWAFGTDLDLNSTFYLEVSFDVLNLDSHTLALTSEFIPPPLLLENPTLQVALCICNLIPWPWQGTAGLMVQNTLQYQLHLLVKKHK